MKPGRPMVGPTGIGAIVSRDVWQERRKGPLIVLLERVEGQTKPIVVELFRLIAIDTDLAPGFGKLTAVPGSGRDAAAAMIVSLLDSARWIAGSDHH